MPKKSEIGKIGENIAAKFLENRGFNIIERNFKKNWGEIDIIARDRRGVLVFVEVKSMKVVNAGYSNNNHENYNNLKPEDNLTRSKSEKLKRTAGLYAGFNEKLIKNKLGWRIDLIAIQIPMTKAIGDDYLLKNLEKNFLINHYENIEI